MGSGTEQSCAEPRRPAGHGHGNTGADPVSRAAADKFSARGIRTSRSRSGTSGRRSVAHDGVLRRQQSAGGPRAAALFVVDEEGQAHGYDKRVRGSAGVPDVIRTFDETLAVFPLESEVGDAIRSAEELPCWRNVLERMEPIWKLWPSYSSKPPALLETEEWAMLREAVQRCVDMHRLWSEEIEFPVTVVNPQGGHHQATSWHELDRLDHAAIAGATIEDARGRRIDLELGPPRTLRRVGLPRPSGQ